jgi:hypothetical protein
METHEAELYIHRILSGKFFYKDYEIVSPDIDTRYRASLIYSECLDQAREEEVMTKEETEQVCLLKGFITQKEIDSLDTIPKDIENFQRELYLNRHSPDKVSSLKKYIGVARSNFELVSKKLGKYYSYSDEGYASFCKVYFLIKETTFLKGEKYSFEDSSVESLLGAYTSNILTPSIIRSVAKSTLWINKWQALKANGVVFPFGYNISDSQQLLLMWSNFYDSIGESAEPPESFVIKDDDMLDGWLLIQKAKRKDKEDPEGLISKNSKIQNAQEVYIVANNIDDIKRIEAMNSAQAKHLKKQRINKLNREGTVSHMNMPDIKQEYMIQATQALREHHARK